jgi:hypothetical protein
MKNKSKINKYLCDLQQFNNAIHERTRFCFGFLRRGIQGSWGRVISTTAAE